MPALTIAPSARFTKTEAGRQEIRARAHALSRGARNLLFILDDTRPGAEWLTLVQGTGPAATASSTVTVQYVGVLYKGGKQFDASWDDGQGKPVTFPLSGVIKGWQQGIPGMRVGGRRELIIPPSLAYGSTAQAKIPANSTLVFVIDLHSIS